MTAPQQASKSVSLPWVTLVLILVNMTASLLGALDHQINLEFAFNPTEPTLHTAVTSLFLHSNVIHLLGNMVFLAAVGPRVESVAGRLQFAVIYFLGGLVGVAAHLATMRLINSSLPLLGASGAIASCVGYCAVRFMSRKVPLAPKINVTVGTVTLLWVGLQALGVFVKIGDTTGGTAFWTHLAGFATGLLLSILFRAPKQAKIQFGHDLLDQMVERGPGAILLAADNHLKNHPSDPRALREKATALHQMGEHRQEAETLVLLLDVVPLGTQVHVLQEIAEADGLGLIPPVMRLKWTERLDTGQEGLVVQILKSVANDPDSADSAPDAILALVPLVDDEEAERLLEVLRSRFALHPATEIARTKGLLK